MFTRSLSYIRDKNKRNFFIYGIGQAFNLFSPLLVAPYVISVCNEDGFGKVGLGFALALFLVLIVDYAFEIKGIKQVSEHRDDNLALQKILTTTVATKLLLFAISLVIALLLIFTLPALSNERPLYLLSLVIVFAQVFNPVWFLQGVEKFTSASILNICSKSLYVLLVYNIVVAEEDYILVNLCLGSSAMLFNLIGLALIKREFKIRFVSPDSSEIRQILKSDFSFCISQLFLSARQLSPLLLASYFLGYYAAGQYKVLEQIMTLFRTYIQVFLKYFFPSACYKIMGDTNIGIAYWKKYSLANLGIVIFSLIVIFLFSEEILRFFNVSEESVALLDGIFVFSLMISLLMAISLPLEQLMFLLNKNRIYVRITIFVTFVTIAGIFILIKPYQLIGIISALLTAEVIFIALYAQNAFKQPAKTNI